MSFQVILTFDIRHASKSKHGLAVYKKIKHDLEKVDLSKVIVGKAEIEKKLPANTYAANFPNDSHEKSSAVVDALAKKLNAVFKKRGVHGRYFVMCGQHHWSWKVGAIRKSSK